MRNTLLLVSNPSSTRSGRQPSLAAAALWLSEHRWPLLWLLMALVHLPALWSASSAVAQNVVGLTAWSRLGWTAGAFIFLLLKALNVRFLRVGSDRRSLVLFIVAALLFHVLAILDVSVVALIEWLLPLISTLLMLLSLNSVQVGLQRALLVLRESGQTIVLELSGFLLHPAPAVLPCLAYVRRRTSLPPPRFR